MSENNARTVYTEEGEQLTEVLMADDLPPEDDDESVWSEMDKDDDMEEEDNGEAVEDMSLYQFTSHTDSVYCTALHPTKRGVVITGGGDDRAFIWSYETNNAASTETGSVSSNSSNRQILFELTGHTDTVSTVGFNFDGTMALTGSYDGTIRVWTVETGELKLVLDGPEDIEFAEWHSKGNAIMAGSKDGTAWMWLAETGQCVQVFAGHDGGVSCGCFTKDGGAVCTGDEDGSIRVWAPVTGKCKHTFEGHFGHEGMVTCLASSSDGELLLSGSVDGKILLFQVGKKKLLQTFVHSVPNDAAAAAVTGGGSISDTAGQALPTPPQRQSGSGRQSTVAVSAATSQASAAVAGKQQQDHDMSESEFGAYDEDAMDEEGEGEEEEEGGTLSVECVGFSSGDFKWIASGGLDKTMKVWDMVSGTCRSVCVHGGSVVALKWHSVLPIVTTASLDRAVRLWDARGGTLLLRLTGHTDILTNLDMLRLPSEGANDHHPSHGTDHPTDVIVSISDDHTARIFHVNAQQILLTSSSSS